MRFGSKVEMNCKLVITSMAVKKSDAIRSCLSFFSDVPSTASCFRQQHFKDLLITDACGETN